MGANYHGTVKWHCYHDCVQAGCPGHKATLCSKHGQYYLKEADGKETAVYADIRLIDAISWTLWRERGLVEDTARGE